MGWGGGGRAKTTTAGFVCRQEGWKCGINKRQSSSIRCELWINTHVRVVDVKPWYDVSSASGVGRVVQIPNFRAERVVVVSRCTPGLRAGATSQRFTERSTNVGHRTRATVPIRLMLLDRNRHLLHRHLLLGRRLDSGHRRRRTGNVLVKRLTRLQIQGLLTDVNILISLYLIPSRIR